MTNNSPDKNKIFPIANNPPSKNNKTPKIIKKSPKAVNPTPISKTLNYKEYSESLIATCLLIKNLKWKFSL
jgi:hypothetical protein